MQLVYDSTPDPEDQKYLDDQLMVFNGDEINGYAFKNFLYQVRDESGIMIAGIDCRVGGGWLEIISLWVSEKQRKKKIGEKLLSAAEKTAKKEGCHSAYLYTYSFQAPEFYKKNGYNLFGTVENYYKHHSKLYLKKRLLEPAD